MSDLKQKRIAVRNFLNYHEKKEDAVRSPNSQSVTVNLKNLSDNNVHDLKYDLLIICDNKENMALSDKRDNVEMNDNNDKEIDKSQQFGSILKRPGNKRLNAKHVEFLDNIGYEDEDYIRYI